MTFEEAIKILGITFIGSITEIPGFEPVKFYLFNAIVEEWLDGNPAGITDADVAQAIEKYGMNMYKQAARVVADKIKLYGDVE